MKLTKKFISILICILMISALAVPVFAAGNTVKYPTIFVQGLQSSTLYTDTENPTESIAIPDASTLVELIKQEVLPAFIVYAANKDIDKLALTLTSVANEAFKHWANNPDGTPVGNSGAINNYPDPVTLNGDSQIYFKYDWRGDPLVIASDLNDYINYIIDNTAYDKVAISSHSLGGIVTLTYLSLYGYDKVAGIVFDSPAIEGVEYVGDLFCGEIEITSEGVLTFLKGTLGENEYKELISSSLDILEMAGLSELVIGTFDDAIDKITPILFKETLLPIFGSWLSIWAMVPPERIDEAVSYVFDDFCKDQDLSVIRGKIEEYNRVVRDNRIDTLLGYDEVGRVAVISRYGHTCFPITSSWNLIGDAVIETQSTSFGAVTAPLGDYFSDEYLEGKDMKYISPDKTIDASSCLFPEKTWFIKEILHEEIKYTKHMHSQLLFGDEEATCDNSEFARFSIFDRETDTISADSSKPQKAEEPTPLQRLFNFLKALLDKLIAFFSKDK
ncbi:MAG: hypothetical protein J6V06_05045 [Clostridia bacterium]|nr:hypothetical protein [Clostridia bacterium]